MSSRSSFDIETYGNNVLSKMPQVIKTHNKKASPKNKNVVHFDTLIPECCEQTEPYNIARTFVSLLELANRGNIEIITNSQEESESNSTTGIRETSHDPSSLFAVRLLSTDKVYSYIDDYRAPSRREDGEEEEEGEDEDEDSESDEREEMPEGRKTAKRKRAGIKSRRNQMNSKIQPAKKRTLRRRVAKGKSVEKDDYDKENVGQDNMIVQ